LRKALNHRPWFGAIHNVAVAEGGSCQAGISAPGGAEQRPNRNQGRTPVGSSARCPVDEVLLPAAEAAPNGRCA